MIGLREGLEAALIVGIIAAFLKRNGHSLKSMWVGVIAAIVLSVGVGVVLEVISVGLPQAQQEGMESVIGAVAVVMVTIMIVWMSKHARYMRSELEEVAGDALARGSVAALAVMAFLAVLREGFETSVFLLAAFQSSVSPLVAGAGAVLGLLLAVVIGYLIYRGGIRLNLGKFFTVTGVFLVFVAAGLVMSALRTAHEAGWIVIGQAATLDLSWLAPNGSVQAALVTGVLGIPADPKVIEVLGWLLYLVPVLLFVLWPHALRPGIRAYRVQFGIAAVAAVAAVVLFIAVPASGGAALPSAPLAITSADGQQVGTAQLATTADGYELTSTVQGVAASIALAVGASTPETRLGQDARTWAVTTQTVPTGVPSTVTLDELSALNGGRTPVGVNRAQNPGPFTVAWQVTLNERVWVVGDTLLDATSDAVTTLSLSDGGLTAPRTVTVSSATGAATGSAATTSGGTAAPESISWTVDAQQADLVSAALSDRAAAADEAALFKFYLPLVLAVAAIVFALFGARGLRAVKRSGAAPGQPAAGPDPDHADGTGPANAGTAGPAAGTPVAGTPVAGTPVAGTPGPDHPVADAAGPGEGPSIQNPGERTTVSAHS
ncbi:iron uptake transporter permease EfeU [Subtercola boreus]|uniref:iron uptake transporter permease EfeU n=1 Tax=Subtercola boreus TaxID=120213 RepID=UPI002482B736|nr:iron uptake transporter permease EfeU [Subtercola boreus]